jgi:ADP-ribose pyrophosphatase YjhB (NUDIX family)
MILRGVEISVVKAELDSVSAGLRIERVAQSTIECVRESVLRALMQAESSGITSVAFAALGCTDGGLPKAHSSKVIAQEIFRYIKDVPFGKTPQVTSITIAVDDDDTKAVFVKNIEGYIGYMSHKGLLGPYLTVDGIVEYDNGIVLIERTNPPLGYALPGGFVDYGETVEHAVVREIKEETNLEFSDIVLLGVTSDPTRDARFHTVSVVYYGKGSGMLRAGDDACAAHVFALDALPQEIAFDHRQLIEKYIAKKNARCA